MLALKAIGLEEQGVAVGLGDGALREGRASGRPFDPSRWRESALRDGPAGLLRMNGPGACPT